MYRVALLCDLKAIAALLPPIFSLEKGSTVPSANTFTPQHFRVYSTVVAAMVCIAQLSWEHFNGGVISHHILHRADLPAISNWWSLLLVPALAWFLTGTVAKRLSACDFISIYRLKIAVFRGFTGSFLIGSALSIAFRTGQSDVAGVLFQGMFLLALFVRVYRAEYLLGFVLAMMFTFGAVLPTAIGGMVGAVAAVVHLLIYPNLKRAWKWVSN